MKKHIYAAGLAVARRQIIAATLLGMFVLLAQSAFWTDPNEPSALQQEPTSGRNSVNILIAAANLLFAIGLIVTSESELKSTASDIKNAARLRKPADPQSVVEQLIAMTGMAALGSAAMTFSEPPAMFSGSDATGTVAIVVAIIWSGAFSVAFAFFAATARAALVCRHSAPS